jgi:hypothetical protein
LSLKDEDLDVFKSTQNLLLELCKSSTGLSLLFSNEYLQKSFKDTMKQNSIQRLRVLETFILIGNLSLKAFSFVSKDGIYDEFVEELKTENILTLLNLFEMLKLVHFHCFLF